MLSSKIMDIYCVVLDRLTLSVFVSPSKIGGFKDLERVQSTLEHPEVEGGPTCKI
jgi:hypothetical protein